MKLIIKNTCGLIFERILSIAYILIAEVISPRKVRTICFFVLSFSLSIVISQSTKEITYNKNIKIII
jgi:hypothetical protein